MEFSFIHAADIHLGRSFSGLGAFSQDSGLKDICRTALERAFNNMIDYAVNKSADFVLIAGDTFDCEEHDFSSKLILKRGLKKLENAGIRVYLICGNHDPLSSYSRKTFDYDENSKIKIIGLNTPACCSLPLITKNGETAGTLHALSFENEKFNENPVKYFHQAESGFNAGILHCDLSGSASSPYAPCLLSELKALNYDYFALGHIHLSSSSADNIQYAGSIQGRNTKETGAHGIRYIKASEGRIIENTFIPMDIIRFEDIEADISYAENTEEIFELIENRITEKISAYDKAPEVFLIRPHITGCTSCFSEINNEFLDVLTERIKSDFSNRVYISETVCSISAKADEKVLKADTGLAGEIYRAAENDEILKDAFEKVSEKIKNFTKDCCFTEEEYENFKLSLTEAAKEECRNISSLIYDTE